MAFNSQLYTQIRPDLLANWNRVQAYKANPNDPQFAGDQNVVNIANNYDSLEQYLQDDYMRNGGPTLHPEVTAEPTPTVANGGGFGGLTPQTPSVTPPQLPNAPVTATPVPGGNFNQNQNSSQTGGFSTLGQSNQTTQQQQGTEAKTNQTETSNLTGTNAQTGTQSGTQTQVGGSVSKPIDTLGFGSLLSGQATDTLASDAARRGFLTDTMNTGGQQFQSQVDQAVRSALSGPQLTGAGDSARARAAGYAGAQIGRQNLDQRLNAAGQLAGPTGFTTLAGAGTPYIGQEQANVSTGTNNNTSATQGSTSQQGSTNTQGTTSSSGFSNLVGKTNEGQAGTATGTGSQAASGLVPQTQQVSSGGGGCVLCTAAIELGLSKHHRVLRKVIAHKLNHDWKRFKYASRGYFFLFTPLARWLLTHPKIATTLWPIAKGVVYEELRVAGRQLPLRKRAWIAHWGGHSLCAVVGRFPVPKCVTDKVIVAIAQKNGILFKVGGDS